MELLLDKGADIEAKSKDDGTALYSACYNGHLEIVELLLDKGADIEAKNQNGSTALILACVSEYREVARLLLDKGADIEAEGKHGLTALHFACYNGDLEIVELLLDKGANIEAKDKRGLTVLNKACAKGHLELAGLLLDKGADIEAKDTQGFTALDWACFKDHLELVDYLLLQGAAIHEMDQSEQLQLRKTALIEGGKINGYTVYHQHWIDGNLKLLKYWLSQNEDINKSVQKVPFGLSPKQFNPEMFEEFSSWLFEQGFLWDMQVETFKDFFNFLKSHDFDFNKADNNKNTILHLACINGDYTLVKDLIQLEPSIDATVKNNSGKMPRDLAAAALERVSGKNKSPYKQIVALLKKYVSSKDESRPLKTIQSEKKSQLKSLAKTNLTPQVSQTLPGIPKHPLFVPSVQPDSNKLMSPVNWLNKKLKPFSGSLRWEAYSHHSEQGFILKIEENDLRVFNTTISASSIMHLLRDYYLKITSLEKTSLFLDAQSLRISGDLNDKFFLKNKPAITEYQRIVHILSQLNERYKPAKIQLLSLTPGQERHFGIRVSLTETATIEPCSQKEFIDNIYQDLSGNIGENIFLSCGQIMTHQLPEQSLFTAPLSPPLKNKEKSLKSKKGKEAKEDKRLSPPKQESRITESSLTSKQENPKSNSKQNNIALSRNKNAFTYFPEMKKLSTAENHLTLAKIYWAMIKANASTRAEDPKGKGNAAEDEGWCFKAYVNIIKFLTQLHEYHKIMRNSSCKISRGDLIMPLRIHVLRQFMRPDFQELIKAVEVQLKTLDWDSPAPVKVFNPALIVDETTLSNQEATHVEIENDITAMINALNSYAAKGTMPKDDKEKISFWGGLGDSAGHVEALIVGTVELSKILKGNHCLSTSLIHLRKCITVDAKKLRNQIVHEELSPIAMVDFIFALSKKLKNAEQNQTRKEKQEMTGECSRAGPSSPHGFGR